MNRPPFVPVYVHSFHSRTGNSTERLTLVLNVGDLSINEVEFGKCLIDGVIGPGGYKAKNIC